MFASGTELRNSGSMKLTSAPCRMIACPVGALFVEAGAAAAVPEGCAAAVAEPAAGLPAGAACVGACAVLAVFLLLLLLPQAISQGAIAAPPAIALSFRTLRRFSRCTGPKVARRENGSLIYPSRPPCRPRRSTR